MVIEVTPDINIDNNRVQSFLTNIHVYKNLANRIKLNLRNEEAITIIEQERIAYEILLTKEKTSFFFVIPDNEKELINNELNVCWPKATFKESNDYIKKIKISLCQEYELKNHFFLSLKVDKRGLFPLPSILESSKILRNDEQVLIQMLLVPDEESWYQDCEAAIKDFEKGYMTERKKFDKKTMLKFAAKFGLKITKEILSLISLALIDKDLEGEQWEPLDRTEYYKLFRQGLSENTKKKANYSAYATSIRIAVDAKNERQQLIMNAFSRCFNELTEDNGFIIRNLDNEKLKNYIKERRPVFKINKDLLSTYELSQLIQIPTKFYQEEYHIENINTREIDISDIFIRDGIRIGSFNYKGRKAPLNFPTDDVNSLCQCWISIGKMGSGKTTCGENTAIQLLKKGYSVFAIDVADGKLIDHIEEALPKDFDKIIDLDFGDIDNPIPLSWTETAFVGENKHMETKLASQLKNFLNKLAFSETTDRMERFLGAAAKAVFKNPNASLYEVILCITNKDFRHKIIEDHNIEGRLKYNLLQLDDEKTGTKLQYISGIMDRLEALMDNEYVANCLLQKANPEINFRKWADEGYFVGIRVPKETLLDDATDLLVTFIVSKLWLAILSRHNISEEERHPCFLILDEPHQFPTVLTELYSIIREMRKWHFGIFILAHEFGDFKGLKTLFKSAGTNYFIYKTSKETYKDLLEELSPFTLEECMRTKWHSAIVNMRYKDKEICVMCEMLAPLPKINDYNRNNIYGNPINLVEEDILSKYQNNY